MQCFEKELASNALRTKVRFGSGQKGCLGVIYSQMKFQVEAGVQWVVPKTQGAYPLLGVKPTNDEKKATISRFMMYKHNIIVVEAVKDLLKNMLTEDIDEDYIIEFKDGLSEYSGVKLITIIEHIRTEYASMDDVSYKELMDNFRDSPNMDAPINKYYRK